MDHEHGLDCDSDYCEDWQSPPRCPAGRHDWSSEGMGGCNENPGVWSLGGTTMLCRDACEHCGIVRTTKTYGSQRNASDCDSCVYEEPETEE